MVLTTVSISVVCWNSNEIIPRLSNSSTFFFHLLIFSIFKTCVSRCSRLFIFRSEQRIFRNNFWLICFYFYSMQRAVGFLTKKKRKFFFEIHRLTRRRIHRDWREYVFTNTFFFSFLYDFDDRSYYNGNITTSHKYISTAKL